MTFPQLQYLIGQWQRETFGHDGLVQETHGKLQEECQELASALEIASFARSKETSEELADVAIVLLGLADRLGVDLEAAIMSKMAVNRTRTWPREKGSEKYQDGCVVPAKILGSDPT